MTKRDEFATIRQALGFLDVAANTLQNWHGDGKIPVFPNPISDYRLFKKSDLEELLRRIEEKSRLREARPVTDSFGNGAFGRS